MPILSELRRRKVFQSVGIYLAAAWLTLEVAGAVTELWELSPWILRGVFLLLLAGIPVVLVVSWLFDFTGTRFVATDRPPARGRARVVAASVVVLLGVVLLALYLWPDDPLSEDVRRLRETTVVAEGDTRTFGYGLYGFNAPAGEDFWQHGRHLITTYNGLGVMPDNPAGALRFTVERNHFCRLRAPDCWPKFVTESRGLAPLLAANAELLDRYRDLRSARSHVNVVHMHWLMPFPPMQNLLVAQSLVGRELWREDAEAAGAKLAGEIAFHRAMLGQSQSVLEKMIAAALLDEDLRLYAQLVARGSDLPAPARLTPPERSLVASYRWEAVSMINALARGRDAFVESLFERPTDRAMFRLLPYLPNRTVNAAVAPMIRAAEASLLPAAAFVERRAEFEPLEPTVGDWFVNTVGAYLVRETPDFLSYVDRLNRIDALIVLAQVARRAHDEAVDTTTIGAFLQSLPRELRSPLDGSPPVWADGELAFAAHEADVRLPLRLALPLPHPNT